MASRSLGQSGDGSREGASWCSGSTGSEEMMIASTGLDFELPLSEGSDLDERLVREVLDESGSVAGWRIEAIGAPMCRGIFDLNAVIRLQRGDPI